MANPYGNVYDWLQFIGAENKQGNITAHECTDIIRKLNLKSFESEYKILIMWMPEFLGKEGNKLLKLIEEPPPNTLFILVAELGREKQKQFIKYFIHLLEQSIRLRVIDQSNNQQDPAGKQPLTHNDFATRLNKLCSLAQQEAIINELDKASYYIERNANAKMLFHALSIRLYHIINNKSLILVS